VTGPRTYKASGIVLHARNLGEADKIITLFTAEYGKLDAVAKGIRRAKSAFAGRLEFTNEVALSLHRGRNLDIITSADILRSHFNAVVQPDAYGAAHLMAELIESFCEPDLPVPEIYALLRGALQAFETSPDALRLLPRFQLRMLDALGLAPVCDQCVRCGETLQGAPGWLDLDAGGLAGMECHQAWLQVVELDDEDVENFRALAAPKATSQRATLTASPRAAKAVEELISYHLGRRPRTVLAQ